jgi:hypothetical protein
MEPKYRTILQAALLVAVLLAASLRTQANKAPDKAVQEVASH